MRGECVCGLINTSIGDIIMSSTIEIIGADGTKHRFISELPTIVECDAWIKKNKTKEEYAHWVEASSTGTQSESALTMYNDWLTDQKIRHEREESDGTTSFSDHTDLTDGL